MVRHDESIQTQLPSNLVMYYCDLGAAAVSCLCVGQRSVGHVDVSMTMSVKSKAHGACGGIA